MPTYETLQRKADRLLKEGDAIGGAEGRRKLRKCRRLRLAAREKLRGRK